MGDEGERRAFSRQTLKMLLLLTRKTPSEKRKNLITLKLK